MKFTAFISIIMHTGGPNPRYAPDTPSRKNRRPSVATNVARPGTSFTPAWPVCMRLLTTSSGYPSTVPTSPAHAPAAASCDALCADILMSERAGRPREKRTAPRNVSRPSCPPRQARRLRARRPPDRDTLPRATPGASAARAARSAWRQHRSSRFTETREAAAPTFPPFHHRSPAHSRQPHSAW